VRREVWSGQELVVELLSWVSRAVQVDPVEIVVVALAGEAERDVRGGLEARERFTVDSGAPPERLVEEPFEQLALGVKDRADGAEAVPGEVGRRLLVRRLTLPEVCEEE
jgi:hypothetical protein